MNPDEFPFPWWLKTAAYCLLAMFGGAMGSILRSQHANTTIKWARVLTETLGAGFVGVLVMLICNETGLSERWTGVIVGVFGWLGANASIIVLENIVYKKLGYTKPPESKNVQVSVDPVTNPIPLERINVDQGKQSPGN